MEQHIVARFAHLTERQQAEKLLLKQGVIDLSHQAYKAVEYEFGEEPLGDLDPEIEAQKHANPQTFGLHVFVERSRHKQAEDTIVQCGGSIRS